MTTSRHGLWFTLVLLVTTWNGSSYTRFQSNLDCCRATSHPTLGVLLLCLKTCNFRSIPTPLPPNLKQLSLWHQNITNIAAGDFPRHDVLQTLNIRESGVVALQPGAFKNLPSVAVLDLTDNKISRLEAGTFMGLDQLLTLHLDDNVIRHIDGEAFAGLFRLKVLMLSNNCLSVIPRGIPSTVNFQLQLILNGNPVTSVPDVDELRHISTLSVIGSGVWLQCDCKLRDIKVWLLQDETLRWYIWCMVGATGKDIRDVPLEDLRCASPDVYVTVDNGTATGNASFTCRTDCQEGLTFAWITPSGDYTPSSYQYSQHYTHTSSSSCKGSPIKRLETRRMCYSVLNIPASGSDTEGTYTCQVTADHADNASVSAVLTVRTGTDEYSTEAYSQATVRVVTPLVQDPHKPVITPSTVDKVEKETANLPGFDLSPTQLILVGLGSFCGCSVMLGVIAACVGRVKAARQADRVNGHRDAGDGQHGTGGQSSDANDTGNGQYENDDQFSDTAGATGGHYENDDQFSDTQCATGGHYENDDQFSDTQGATGGQYENDDQFSDTAGATNGHYENDDQSSDTAGATGGHYENNDQFSDTQGAAGGHYENDDQFSDEGLNKNSHKTALGNPTSGGSGETSSAARAKRTRRRHNNKGLGKTRAMTVSHIVAIHTETQASGHYDNERKEEGRKEASVSGESDSKIQTTGHYDNDKSAKGSASNACKIANYDSDSEHDYMTLPGNSVTGQETEQAEVGSKAEDNNPDTTSLSATEVSENEYMALPGADNSGDGFDHTYVALPTENAGDNSGHNYQALLGTQNGSNDSNHTYQALLNTENTVDNRVTLPGTENCGAGSDHSYVTLPCTENDHSIVTFSDAENASERQVKTEQKDRQVSDPATGVSDAGDYCHHVYVTLPETENSEEQHVNCKPKKEKET
uniref:Ig-like domain-containing protein n=1 Tax=Branchiostoma floridae TaxID=7739 RepID=C3YRH0_BRAFL|eukprot:XP_002601155.1 hypothetical protein BRAFLDRAFT_75603 [Branchiostoma floridae]